MSNFADILNLLVQRHASNLDCDFPESLSPLLKTNNLPSESDTKVLETLSKRVSNTFRLITSDMELLIGAHSQLTKIQDHLLRVDDDIKIAMSSSTERLPVELLVQVFREATSTRGNPLDMRWEPFVISRVCHKWRVLATEQCPEIWTKFMFEHAVWDDVKGPAALLSLVLSRGVKRLLEFSFDAPAADDVSETNSEADSLDEDNAEIDERRPSHCRREDSATGQLLQVLVRHCHRWRDVRFSIPADLSSLLSPIRGKLPALIHFCLDCDHVYSTPSSILEPFILDGAPLLKTVSLSCLKTHFPVLIPAGVPNLTSYTDFRPGIQDPKLRQHFLNIIRTSPHLKSFSISDMCPPTDPTPRVAHPGIAHLRASDGTFLRSLTLPGLTKMELHRAVMFQGTYEISSLYDLVVHSACNLSSLKVVNCRVNEDLIHILEASPDLTTLILEIHGSETNNSPRTIKSLFDQLRSSEHVLVPRLQSLALSLKTVGFLSTYDELFDSSFGYTIEDRWRNRSLCSLTVAIEPIWREFKLSPISRRRLMMLKDEGMNVEFRRSGTSLV
ncbi:hypothetical protein IW261DRAFT_654732 [Armillaria novae-zelandiae]|uniref:F-box domain-containing protein n=1 Tax=Armillaria novae-zelandiae TaxID=153914 RepID=A0AA39ULI2_9AGAR|nr:hypothetical protein IW261DRAFT_654732 [Armillaria novae-zelandiae]